MSVRGEASHRLQDAGRDMQKKGSPYLQISRFDLAIIEDPLNLPLVEIR